MNNVALGRQYLSKLEEWNGKGGFALTNVRAVLSRLGDPHLATQLVHVAGTNGKGSVSATIASILGRAGFRVGLTISPHLIHIHERIVFDGRSIEDNMLGEFANDIRTASAKEGIVLSLHEALTVIAFLGFRETAVEWGVVEVGLGGRLDSSNVIETPRMSVVVSIDHDHGDLLGETLEQIAREKAGIIKKGCPVLVGRVAKGPLEEIRRIAQSNTSPCLVSEKDFRIEEVGGLPKKPFSGVVEPGPKMFWREPIEFSTSLPGCHQIQNAGLAVVACRELGMSPATCIEGVSNVFWPARLETLSFSGRQVILDCAHNPAGIKSLISFLDREGIGRFDLAFGALESKDWKSMVASLAPRVKTWHLFLPDSPRAVDIEDLHDEVNARISGTDVRIFKYGRDYEGFLRNGIVDGDESMVIAGSMYLVGRLRGLMIVSDKPIWTKA